MKIYLRTFFSLVLLSKSALIFAQQGVSVNMQTGAANVNIPIYTINRGDVSLPVSLVYETNGVKISDAENNAGIGWQVVAGGQISRTLRGLPDDVKKDNGNNTRLGWLYNTNGTKINSFSISNDGSTATCTDETADISYINTNFGDLSDTEPDLFSINAPGLSCQFVFDSNQQIRTIPYQDLKITYVADPVTGLISSFTVVNDKGIKYVFAILETVTRQTTTTNVSNINFFKTDYNLYKNGINYNATWYLQSITDVNNNGLTLTYSPDSLKSSNLPVRLVMGGASGTTTYLNEYSVLESHHPKIVSHISSSRDDTGIPWLTFIYIQNSNSGQFMIQNIQGSGRDILFNYATLSSFYHSSTGQYYTRTFLTSIAQRNCDLPMGYHFTYAGNSSSILPDSASTHTDYWGFYAANSTATSLIPALDINPANAASPPYAIQASASKGSDYTYSLTGSARRVDTTSVMAGALSQITYAKGGSTSITYESNDYYDAPAGVVAKGGGIRVKMITDYDGLDSTRNMVRTYRYANPATGLSSGKPVSLPLYGFTIPYSGTGTPSDLWNFSTVRSENDLSSEDESIMYSQVKVAQSGAGSSLYQYTLPATYWDTSVPDWSPNMNYIARTNCTATDYTRNCIYGYPFAPTVDYDFERGLLTKLTSFNESNQEVSETTFNYVRSASPITITGLKIDDNLTAKSYVKYQIYAFCSELQTQKTTKVFDTPTLSHAVSSSTSYTYGSSQHKLPTVISTTNSDGSTKLTNLTYTKDYTIGSTTDTSSIAIQNLQALNINQLVERQDIVQRTGVNKTISAELTKFKGFTTTGGTLYLPAKQLKFIAADGVTDFQPATSGSGTFTNDSRYITVANYLNYDYTGSLQSSDDNNRHIQSIVTDNYTGLPVVKLTNVSVSDFEFNDFDSKTTGNSFVVQSGTSTTATGRTGKNGLSLTASAVMGVTLNKNLLAQNYLFSCWINTPSAGNITVTLTSSAGSHSYVVPVSVGTGWQYYQLKIPVTAVSGSMTASFQSSVNLIVDDILLYPDVATAATVAYDPIWHVKTAQTNTNGVSTYFDYDANGQLQYTYDQDHNIVAKSLFVRANDVTSFVVPSFTTSYFSSPYTNRVITFTNGSTTNSCLVGNSVTYTWNFGDGSAPFVGVNATHSYATAGTYTITLTATSASFGQKITTRTQTITTPPATIPVNYVDDSSGATITSVKFNQGSTVVYSFVTSDITSGTARVVPDKYQVVVTLAGTTSNFNSFTYMGGITQCYAKQTAVPSVFTITDNSLASKTSLTLQVNIGNCSTH